MDGKKAELGLMFDFLGVGGKAELLENSMLLSLGI